LVLTSDIFSYRNDDCLEEDKNIYKIKAIFEVDDYLKISKKRLIMKKKSIIPILISI